MRKRLIAIACAAVSLVPSAVSAAVISFENASDLSDFQQSTTNFWTRTADAGIKGSHGLVGANTGNAGWLTYSAGGFAPQNATLSTGIYFKLHNPPTTSSGYSLAIGIGPSANYTPNMTSGSEPGNNHILGGIHYNGTGSAEDPHKFRLAAIHANNGEFSPTYSDYTTLAFDSWYYLALDISFDQSTSLYSYTVSLFNTNADGEVIGAAIMQITADNVSVPGLSSVDQNYQFFGVMNRSTTRGISAVDNFTYTIAVPEANSLTLLSVAGLGALGLRRQFLRR